MSENRDEKNGGKKKDKKNSKEGNVPKTEHGEESALSALKLGVEKRFIIKLPDEQVREILRMAAERGEAKEKQVREAPWSYKVPESAIKRLNRLKMMFSRDNNDKRWLVFTEKIMNIRFTPQSVIGDGSDKAVYMYLKQQCEDNDLPSDFALSVIPSVMEYMNTGHMRPIILVGPAGCGKTTGGKILAGILGLPYYLISSSRVDHGHGIYGEGSSFQSPSIGELANGIIETGSLNLVYIIDEIEKAPKNLTRTSIDDEMLSICDESVSEFRDNFLEYELPIKNSPIIMTCNELEGISAPLIDRCNVYRFSDVEVDRMISIVGKYADKVLRERYRDILSVDPATLEKAVRDLYDTGVRSVRRHKSLVEGALQQAYRVLLETEAERPMAVTDEIFGAQAARIAEGSRINLGF